VALEAQAAGVPVVASDLPVLREFLTPGEDCLMAPPGDPPALVAALVRAAGDDALRRRLVAAGRVTAGRFGWDAAAAAHEAVYGRVRVAA
jgi:glycosyltransferase involved in cell wall biosynthesis